MEYMVGYTALIKLLGQLFIILLVILGVRYKYYKTSMLSIIIVFLIINYVKIDGTNTSIKNVRQDKITNSQKELIINETKEEISKDLSFEDKIKIESDRSIKENNRMKKEMML